MNHANDPEWRENLADIKLNIVATDLNLQKTSDTSISINLHGDANSS